MVKPLPEPMPIDEARSTFCYDPETGVIIRKRGGTRFVGTEAGSIHRTGYRVVKVKSKQVLAQRLAWFLHYGEWPGDRLVDHKNRCKVDNRIANLRLATDAENLANSNRSYGSSGFRGVQFDKRKKSGRRWFAVLKYDYGYKYLGCFHTPEEASVAYRVAAVDARGDFAVPLNEEGLQ